MNDDKWIAEIREDFPILKIRRNGKPPVYLDSACTTLVPQVVIDALNKYYQGFSGCGGARSRHWFAAEVMDRIEGNPEKGIKGSRQIIQEFINAGSVREIVFTLNASHAINIVALGFPFQPGDTVLLTDKEHNSNLLPWLRLQEKGIIQVDHVMSDENNHMDINDLKRKLENSRVKLVSMAYTSNLTGYTIPAAEVIKIAHDHKARVLLDAAQTASHRTIDVRALDVDFLAFSIHKICGPKGVGVLYGKQDLLGGITGEIEACADAIQPSFIGGGTVGDTTYNSYSLLDPPERFEVGIQNFPGQIAAGTAVTYLQGIGMDKINTHINRLNGFLTEQLLARYGDTGWFRILGPKDAVARAGILTFEIQRPNAVGIAEELSDRANVMIRDGVFCVHSYLNEKYGEGWTRPRLPAEHRMTNRVSLYFYNTMEECRVFLDTLHGIFEERGYLDF